MSMQQIDAAEVSKEVPINENFETLEHQAVYGKAHETTAGLVWGYYGGRWGGFSVTAGTFTLTASGTNYIVVAIADGVTTCSTSSTNWSDTTNYRRVYKLTTGSSSVTATEDHRAGLNGVHGSIDATTAAPAETTTTIGALIDGATGKTTPVDADEIGIADSAASFILKKLTWANLKATLKTYFDTLYGSGSGDVVGQSSSVDSEIALFSGTGGKTIKRATGSGLVKVTSGVYSVATKGTDYGQTALAVACSDETTALTTGTNKVKFINPYATAFNVTAVVGSLSTAQTSGSIFTVDINEAGTTILSTKLTIDNTETNSSTAATPAVISDASIAAYAEIGIDIDQVGDGTAKGLKVYLIGYPS